MGEQGQRESARARELLEKILRTNGHTKAKKVPLLDESRTNEHTKAKKVPWLDESRNNEHAKAKKVSWVDESRNNEQTKAIKVPWLDVCSPNRSRRHRTAKQKAARPGENRMARLRNIKRIIPDCSIRTKSPNRQVQGRIA